MNDDSEARRAWRVGPYLLDESRFEARRDGVLIEVQKHVLDLLFFLLRSEGRLVTEREYDWDRLDVATLLEQLAKEKTP